MNGDPAPCQTCRKPKNISIANWEAWQTFLSLHTHGRQWDTMGGNMLPLHIADVRREAAYTVDPDTTIERVLIVDDIFLNAWAEKKKTKTQ